MKRRSQLLLAICVLFAVAAVAAEDPLPAWNDGAAKQAILNFVKATTDPPNSNFVPPEQRFAIFDQDGPTWVISIKNDWNRIFAWEK